MKKVEVLTLTSDDDDSRSQEIFADDEGSRRYVVLDSREDVLVPRDVDGDVALERVSDEDSNGEKDLHDLS